MEYATEALSDEASEITPNDLADELILGIGSANHTSSTSIFC